MTSRQPARRNRVCKLRNLIGTSSGCRCSSSGPLYSTTNHGKRHNLDPRSAQGGQTASRHKVRSLVKWGRGPVSPHRTKRGNSTGEPRSLATLQPVGLAEIEPRALPWAGLFQPFRLQTRPFGRRTLNWFLCEGPVRSTHHIRGKLQPVSTIGYGIVEAYPLLPAFVDRQGTGSMWTNTSLTGAMALRRRSLTAWPIA